MRHVAGMRPAAGEVRPFLTTDVQPRLFDPAVHEPSACDPTSRLRRIIPLTPNPANAESRLRRVPLTPSPACAESRLRRIAPKPLSDRTCLVAACNTRQTTRDRVQRREQHSIALRATSHGAGCCCARNRLAGWVREAYSSRRARGIREGYSTQRVTAQDGAAIAKGEQNDSGQRLHALGQVRFSPGSWCRCGRSSFRATVSRAAKLWAARGPAPAACNMRHAGMRQLRWFAYPIAADRSSLR